MNSERKHKNRAANNWFVDSFQYISIVRTSHPFTKATVNLGELPVVV